jgi:hypothetical protein
MFPLPSGTIRNLQIRIHWIPIASFILFVSSLELEQGVQVLYCSARTLPSILSSVGGFCCFFQVPAVAPLHHRQAGLGRDGQKEHAGGLYIILKIYFCNNDMRRTW